jgi:hypothetical protein
MDASRKVSKNTNDIYKVRDPSGLLWTLFGMAPLAALSFFVNTFFFNGLLKNHVDMFSMITLFICNFPLVIISLRLHAIWKGIELDIENRMMSFPGGEIEANDFADYFKLDYLLQYFKRYEISLDEISQIRTENITITNHDTNRENTTYKISFVGTFGAASVNFSNGGKRDQIYTAIRELNQMGTPYVKAN